MFKFLQNKKTRSDFLTYALVILAFIVVSFLKDAGMIPRMIAGQLVPICAYIVMAISLNLVVGVAGDLSLGHAGFMSVGAYSGIVAAMSLSEAIPQRHGPSRDSACRGCRLRRPCRVPHWHSGPAPVRRLPRHRDARVR